MSEATHVDAARVGNGSPVPPVAVPKKKRHRSPSYPAINLEEAIERAKTMYKHERKNAAALNVVVQHWGYGVKSSSGLVCAAAMKKYGLLVEVAGGKDRNIRLSDVALKIILDEREDSTERMALIREAALKPEIHREIWDKWKSELPSDATFRTYLIRDKDFTEVAANQFIDEYKHTISFAQVKSSDTIPNRDGDEESDESDTEMNPAVHEINNPKGGNASGGMPGAAKQLPKLPSGQKDFPAYLTNNQRAVLYVPESLTAKDYELLKTQIENHLAIIAATSVADEPN